MSGWMNKTEGAAKEERKIIAQEATAVKREIIRRETYCAAAL